MWRCKPQQLLLCRQRDFSVGLCSMHLPMCLVRGLTSLLAFTADSSMYWCT